MICWWRSFEKRKAQLVAATWEYELRSSKAKRLLIELVGYLLALVLAANGRLRLHPGALIR